MYLSTFYKVCVCCPVWVMRSEPRHPSPAVTDGEALSASLARPPLGGSGERLATSDGARHCWLGQRLMVCCVTAGPSRTSRTSRGPRSRWRKGMCAHLLPNLLAASISFFFFFYIIQTLGRYFELYFLKPNVFPTKCFSLFVTTGCKRWSRTCWKPRRQRGQGVFFHCDISNLPLAVFEETSDAKSSARF